MKDVLHSTGKKNSIIINTHHFVLSYPIHVSVFYVFIHSFVCLFHLSLLVGSIINSLFIRLFIRSFIYSTFILSWHQSVQEVCEIAMTVTLLVQVTTAS